MLNFQLPLSQIYLSFITSNKYIKYIKRTIFLFLYHYCQRLILSSDIPFSPQDSYYYWLFNNYPRKSDFQQMNQELNNLSYQPIISIVLVINDPRETYLEEAIKSVISQIYDKWELCLVTQSSNSPNLKSILDKYSQDPRCQVIDSPENINPFAMFNQALSTTKGDFITFITPHDQLTPNALYEVVYLLNQHSEADLIYSDEDQLLENGWLTEPYFKPNWCPDSFLSRMYIGNLAVYRKKLVEKIGGFRPEFEEIQQDELILRLTEKTDKIFHIPKILDHHRLLNRSTHSTLKIIDLKKKALEEAIHRRGEKGQIELTKDNDYLVRYDIKEPDLVSIIIPSKNLGQILDRCLDSIFSKTIYPHYEVLLIDNGTTENEALSVIQKWQTQEPTRLRVEKYDIPFNYAKINNYGVNLTQGKYLLFLNNDIEVITPDWINAMVEQAQRPSIGAVGALLLYPDDTVQHAGVIGLNNIVAGHSHKYLDAQASGYFGQLQTINNYLAVTAACLMCRKELFRQVGGFEEDLAIAFNDVDLCLKMFKEGYQNIYLPHVKLYHYESKSRGYENTAEKQKRFNQETQYLQNKWSYLLKNDPCYNPNLTQKVENFTINLDY